jgi:hypothetical protein
MAIAPSPAPESADLWPVCGWGGIARRSFGISFPTNPGPLAPIHPAAFAKYAQVDFGSSGAPGHAAGFSTARVRLCLPGRAATGGAGTIQPATALVLRTGSPEDGPVLARLDLSSNASALAHAHCGYLIGSYWAPGVMNDDPAAMSEVTAALEGGGGSVGGSGSEAAPLRGRHDVFLLVEGGGHVAIDWLRFERSQAI